MCPACDSPFVSPKSTHSGPATSCWFLRAKGGRRLHRGRHIGMKNLPVISHEQYEFVQTNKISTQVTCEK